MVKPILKKLFALNLLLLVGSQGGSQANGGTELTVDLQRGSSQIAALRFPADRIPILSQTQCKKWDRCIRIAGVFTKKQSALAVTTKNGPFYLVKPGEAPKQFSFLLPLTADSVGVSLEEIGHDRNLIQKESLIITVTGSRPSSGRSNPLNDRTSIALSGGYVTDDYLQSGQSGASKLYSTLRSAVQGKFGVKHWLKPRALSLGLNVTSSLVPLAQSGETGKVRFIHADWQLGYLLPFFSKPWEVELMTGSYYKTMIVSDQAYGYQNNFGIQGAIRISRAFGNHALTIYGKTGPLLDGFIPSSFSNGESAAGASWNWAASRRMRLSLLFDWSEFSYIQNTSGVFQRSMSFGMGLGFGW